MIRQGLRLLISQRADWEICGEAATGREAVELAIKHKPDVVVMDFSMPILNGLEATRRIREELPHTEVLILTMHENDQVIRDVLAAGARGYLLKSDGGKLLTSAIESLCKHKPYFTPKVSEMVLSGYLNPPGEEDSGDRLTSREREIVQLIAEGKSSKEVSSTLNISVKTVEAHRTNIMRKLNVHSLGEIVRYAVRNRIVEP
jgi:DNA-binding NarL/FixJ family response regulator